MGLWTCGFMQSGVCRGSLVYKTVSRFVLHFVLRGVFACVGIAMTTNSSQITEISKVKTTSMCGANDQTGCYLLLGGTNFVTIRTFRFLFVRSFFCS